MQFAYPYEAHRQAGVPVMGEEWRDDIFFDQDMAGVIFQGCRFVNVRLERVDFSKCVFVECVFEVCGFADCSLYQTQFTDCKGSRVEVAGGTLEETTVAQTELERLEVSREGRMLVLSESAIEHLRFRDGGLDQRQITLSGCAFGRLEALGAHWRDGLASELDFSACEFGDGRFERTAFVKAAAAGLDLSRLDFNACNLYRGDFRGARLRRAGASIFAESLLEEADLRRASLDGALFAKVKADGARFDGASLNGALFPEASLAGASFEGASAREGIFSGADLSGANLARMDAASGVFRNTRLDGANVDDASFVSAQLHGVEEKHLDGADTRGAASTVEWRAEREREALNPAG